jgi:RNA polymerase sigma-70 factor (ECF subfamily)
MTIQLMSEPSNPTEGLLLHGGTAEHEALEAIYDQFAPLVWCLVHRVVQDETNTEEVTCQVLFEVWQNPNGVDTTAAGTYSWVLGLARTHALAWRLAQAPAGAYQESNTSSFRSGTGRQSEICRALADLSLLQRKAIELVYYRGLRRDEAAVVLNASEAAVTAALCFGLMRLRDAIKGNRTMATCTGPTNV